MGTQLIKNELTFLNKFFTGDSTSLQKEVEYATSKIIQKPTLTYVQTKNKNQTENDDIPKFIRERNKKRKITNNSHRYHTDDRPEFIKRREEHRRQFRLNQQKEQDDDLMKFANLVHESNKHKKKTEVSQNNFLFYFFN